MPPPKEYFFFNATTTPLANLLCSLRHIVCTPRASPFLDAIQDFLCKLGMIPQMHLVETIILSQNHIIVRPTKIIKDLLKDRKILIFKVIFSVKN